MLKIRSVYYREPIRRTMDEEERANFEGQILELKERINRMAPMQDMFRIKDPTRELKRIADALERLLKYTEMNL